ncbi:6123_t:CDS:2 [Funneliformis caledonium]|uniref:6123_t:CDS:1 n=1 Tax=Funneliformis caledonium TaxID=1117310 RepID=A0A9N9FFZ7_9GLOM|nr:6123_t:CDS:2 [Funneliformis caledonium]
MPAKVSLICLVHSINEKDSTNYVIREAIIIVRREDNTSMELKVTSFIPKSSAVPRWIPLYNPENIVRLTGKFTLDKKPPHDPTLQVTANADDITGLSVFITGFITKTVKIDNLFKTIKITVTEYIGKGSAGNNFIITCRYLKSDERIDKKVIKTRKNSNLMITRELTFVDPEFVVEIQDINFLPMSIANVEPASGQSSGRISAQVMANTSLSNDEE